MNDLFLTIIFSCMGAFLGILTGLIPGLHTNNVALILSMVFPAHFLIAILIVSASISHTFLNIIPSTFIGAPEEDTALAVLPAHSMLLRGEGYTAIKISAMSSLYSVIACFILLIPFYLVLKNFYGTIEENILSILICISLLLLLTSKNIASELLIYFLAGIFGLVIIDMETSFLFSSSPIFPALTGLFAIPALLHHPAKEIPPQSTEEKGVRINNADIAGGVAGGGIVAILPGVSSAIATAIALVLKREKGDKNVISILSSANTATNFFVLACLFIIMKARSGFAVVIKETMSIERWEGILIPYGLCFFLISIIVSSTISYFSTLFIGKTLAKNVSKISYPLLLKISLTVLITLVFISNGLTGLLILFTASCIGILCLKLKVRRSTCMSFLIFPLIVRALGI